MAASGELKERIQLLQAAVARGEATGKALKPEIAAELESYRRQGLLGNNEAKAGAGGATGARKKGYDPTALDALSTQLSRVQQLYRDNLRGVNLADFVNTPAAGQFDSASAGLSDQALAAFRVPGVGSQSDRELASFVKANQPSHTDYDATIEEKLRNIRTRLDARRKSVGLPEWDYEQGKPKGGDLQSDGAGAAIPPGGTPPVDPGTPPPQNRDAGGTVQFGDEGQPMATGFTRLTDEQAKQLQDLAQTGASAERLAGLVTGFGRAPDAEGMKNLEGIAAFYANPENRKVPLGVSYARDELKPVDAGDGARGAGVRGTADVLTAGAAPALYAVADTITKGGTFAENYDRTRGVEMFDEQEHGTARLVGQLVGGAFIPTTAAGAARAATLGAYREARAAGEAADVARRTARAAGARAFAARSTQEGAAYGGVYGFNTTDGGAGERLAGAGLGAAVGGLAGGATALGGSRIQQVLRDRAAARGGRRAAAYQAQLGEAERRANLARIAREESVAILPQDVTQGGLVTRMTQNAAQSPLGSGTITRAADEMADSFARRVDELGAQASGTSDEAGTLADVGAPIKAASAERAAQAGRDAERLSLDARRSAGPSVDPVQAGKGVLAGVTQWEAKTSSRAADLFDRVPIPETAEASLTSTRRYLGEVTGKMRSNPDLANLFENSRFKGFLSALTPRQVETPQAPLVEYIPARVERLGPGVSQAVPAQTIEIPRAPVVTEEGGRLSWNDLQTFRTHIGDVLADPRIAPKIPERELSGLYKALTQDMEQTARNNGPEAYEAWKRANRYYAARMSRLKNTLSLVTGERRGATSAEAFDNLQRMLMRGRSEQAGSFMRVLRSIPPEDAARLRGTIVQDARGGRVFDAKAMANAWDDISDEGRAALLPDKAAREQMQAASDRVADIARDPLANLSSEQTYLALERLATNRGDSAEFVRRISEMPADQRSAVLRMIYHRLGRAEAAGEPRAIDDFSIATFFKRWKTMTPEARRVVAVDASHRQSLDNLFTLAGAVKRSDAMRGASNTGAINAAAYLKSVLVSGVSAAGAGAAFGGMGALVAPVVYLGTEVMGAKLLTSPRLTAWLTRIPKKPNIAAQRQHIRSLSGIARAEPAIANEVLDLQRRLSDAFGGTVTRAAADEGDPKADVVERQRGQQQPARQSFTP